MAFALIITGIVLLIAAARNQSSQLFSLLANDFVGPNNFIYWAVAILVVGSVGYIPKLKPLSVGFITLVIVVLVLKRGNPSGSGGGFFQQFLQQINSTQAARYTSSGSSTGIGNLLSGLGGSNSIGGGLAGGSSINGLPGLSTFGSDTGGLTGSGPLTGGPQIGSGPLTGAPGNSIGGGLAGSAPLGSNVPLFTLPPL